VQIEHCLALHERLSADVKVSRGHAYDLDKTAERFQVLRDSTSLLEDVDDDQRLANAPEGRQDNVP
jgi:hypothetical protein